jgi:antitoxin (DNA-binding transcriptional repressor) of toxin-antitoxin stability system
MSTITIHDIKTDPQSFLDRVEAGEAFLVLRDNHPVAEVKPVANHAGKPRPYGLAAGEFKVPADFNSPLPENILEEFEGR